MRTPVPASGVERLASEQLRDLRLKLREAGVNLDNQAAAEEKLRELRGMYEPFVQALAERLLLTLPPFVALQETPDNWQRSAGCARRRGLANCRKRRGMLNILPERARRRSAPKRLRWARGYFPERRISVPRGFRLWRIREYVVLDAETNKNDSDDRTRVSLLAQLGKDPNDSTAWNAFEARYRPRIVDWCRRWGMQDSDTQDVAQMVLLRLAVKMRGFKYDSSRSFRGWLRTLTRHAWSDYLMDRRRSVAADTGPRALDALQTVAARDDLERRMEEAFDLELLELATSQVRKRVAAHTWEAFVATAIEGLPAADAAARLGMSVVSIFKARSNVQKMLRQTIAELESRDGKTRDGKTLT